MGVALRIVVISHEFPPYFFGGGGTYALDLARALLRRGHDVIVVAGRATRPVWQSDDALPVLRLNVPDFKPRHLWFQLMNRDEIIRVARTADVVHALPVSASLLVERIVSDLGKVVVATVDGSFRAMLRATLNLPFPQAATEILSNLVASPLHVYMSDLDAKKSSHLAVQSEHVRTEMLSVHGRRVLSKTSIIPGAIDFEALRFVLPLHELSSACRRVLFVGRLYWTKGVVHAVEAIRYLVQQEKIRDVTLTIVGKGPVRSRVISIIKRYKLAPFVNLVGHLPRSATLRLMADSDALILPSLYESCPRVLLEAKAIGLPTVLFDFPWTREFANLGIKSEMAEPLNSIDLAHKMLAACSQPRIQHGCLNELAAFDMNGVTEKLVDIYSQLVRGTS